MKLGAVLGSVEIYGIRHKIAAHVKKSWQFTAKLKSMANGSFDQSVNKHS